MVVKKNTKVNPFKTMDDVRAMSNPKFIGMAINAAMGMAQMGMSIAKNVKDKRAAEDQAVLDTFNENQSNISSQVSGGGKISDASGRQVNAYPNGGIVPTKTPVSGGLQEFNGGLKHEEHPMGGVPIGVGPNGKPDTVEHGETAVNIKQNGKQEKVIFSNDIAYVPNEVMPKWVKGNTLADASKSIKRAFEGRHDKYSKNTEEALYARLAVVQIDATAQVQAKQGTTPGRNGTGGFAYQWGGNQLKKETLGQTQNTEQVQEGWTDEEIAALSSGIDAGTVQQTTAPTKGEFALFDEGLAAGMPKLGVDAKGYDPTIPVAPELTGVDKWKAQSTGDKVSDISAAVGALTQVSGIVANTIMKKRMKEPEAVTAHTINTGNMNPYLVNRQNIQREIAGSTATGTRIAAESSGGSAGAYASNALGVHSNSLKASAAALLNADIADATEKARVQQLKTGVGEFNAKAMTEADVASAQNRAAYDAQKSAYNMGIVGNVGAMGEALMNYGIATKSGRYLSIAEKLNAASEQPQRGR